MLSAGWKRLVVVLGIGIGAAAVYSCKSSSQGGLAATCSISSDCDSPLICAFGHCHAACAATIDCPPGETCLLSGTVGVCQLPGEAACTSSASCPATEVCASGAGIQGQQCRSSCTSSAGCFNGQQCLPVGAGQSVCIDTTSAATDAGVDGAKGQDSGAATDTSIPDGGQPKDGSRADGTVGDSGSSPDGNPCPSPATAFGSTAQGDSNPSFQSGVGARTANDLLIFSGSVGPASGGDGGAVSEIYVQAFDPTSGASQGPAQPLFSPPSLVNVGDSVGSSLTLYASAIAPTGQIALLYQANFVNSSVNDTGLYAAFLAPGGDGGAAGLSLLKVVLLESIAFRPPQPHVIWSNSNSAFVFSWIRSPAAFTQFIAIGKFTASGQSAGGGTSAVPTDSPDDSANYNGGQDMGSVGESRDLFGATFLNITGSTQWLTVVDGQSNLVGSPIEVTTMGAGNWIEVGGTAGGFVYFYDQQSPGGVTSAFLASSGDAGVMGGFADGGDAGFPTFTFPGGIRARAGRAIADDTGGGAGGVGLALLYTTGGASFAYVNSDGISHTPINSVLTDNYSSQDEVSLTNLAGSFVLSLYSANAHSTQVVASGCP
jgi:hypothetical protein